jgi:PhoD-like phosphatase
VASLQLGPLLRYVGETVATVWVETDAPCDVEVLGHRERTFEVCGHHYALVCVEGLEAGQSHPYEVALDGRRVWPPPEPRFPDPVIRTLEPDAERLRLGFASCRVSAPHEPPYVLSPDDHPEGKGVDSLRTLALRMRDEPPERWPDAFLLLGDQVYADDVSPGTREFIQARRDGSVAPLEEVTDFEEYTRLYWDSWRDPAVGWLLSVVPTAMIFDDHDVNDDWNTSQAWVDKMRAKPWWPERIRGALMSYWVYQHLGNLSPRELDEDETYDRVRRVEGDAEPILRELAERADRGTAGTRWSFHRDWGHTRLVVMDSRGGRMLGERREMVDDDEWEWIVGHATGDVNHLLLGTSLPVLLTPAMHDFEAWNEAVCDGAWGRAWSHLGEAIRQGADLEHWAAFGSSVKKLFDLLRSVGTGKRGGPPASIVMLSGDVHHAYLAEMAFRRSDEVRTPVWQAVCSPMRNPLGRAERAGIRFALSGTATIIGRLLRRAGGVPDPGARWRFVQEPTFDNQVAVLEIDGREAVLRLEKTVAGETPHPRLHTVLERRLTAEPQAGPRAESRRPARTGTAG